MNDQLSIFNKNRIFFEEFLRKTNQKKNTNNFLVRNFPAKHKKIEILSIGSGSGEDAIAFLEYLKSKNINFKFYYLDPSKPSFNLFRKKSKKARLLKYISHVKFGKFELFKTKEKFDIIIASHVFYYIGNWEKSLRKLHKLLNNNGRGFIFIQSKDSDNFKFRNKFLRYIFGENYNEKFGEELIRVIKRLGLSYKTRKIASILDMRDAVLRNNKISQAGKKILSFLLRTNYYNLDNNLKSRIDKYLLKNTKIKNKGRIFKLIDNYIIIYK